MSTQIRSLARAIKRPTPPRPILIYQTTARIIKMRASPIYKRKNRPIIEQYAPMTRATRPATISARQLYHKRRENSATLDVWWK